MQRAFAQQCDSEQPEIRYLKLVTSEEWALYFPLDETLHTELVSDHKLPSVSVS